MVLIFGQLCVTVIKSRSKAVIIPSSEFPKQSMSSSQISSKQITENETQSGASTAPVTDNFFWRCLRLLQLPKKQGVPDSVKRNVPWISPSLYNHGVSKGIAACTLSTGETNAVYLKNGRQLKELILAIEENRVQWRFPEETAIPHLYCLLLRGK